MYDVRHVLEKLVFVPRTLVITILLQQSPSFSKIRNFYLKNVTSNLYRSWSGEQYGVSNMCVEPPPVQ